MEEIAVSKFKATCLAVLQRVHKTRKPILITRFGKPIAEVVPPPPPPPAENWLGSWRVRAKFWAILSARPPLKRNGPSSTSEATVWTRTFWSGATGTHAAVPKSCQGHRRSRNELWISPVTIGRFCFLHRKGRLNLKDGPESVDCCGIESMPFREAPLRMKSPLPRMQSSSLTGTQRILSWPLPRRFTISRW